MTEDIKSKLTPNIECDPQEITEYLNCAYDVYMKMGHEELFEVVWKLRQYSLFIKKEYNESAARARWCYNNIIKVGKPAASEFDSYDKDERLQCAIQNNEHLKKLQDAKIKYDSDVVLLEGVDRSISYLTVMLERLLDYKFERIKNERNSKDS